MAATNTKEIVTEMLPLVRIYNDGSVERLMGSPIVPPCTEGDPETGVLSKDVVISENPSISARIYLPRNSTQQKKLPILVYFHAGGFCIESAFSFLDQRYLNHLVSEANVVAVSVEYRLAPEDLLPAAYDDSWTALQWVVSHSVDNPTDNEPWLTNYGDFDKVYIGGDSAGGNIVHNVAMRAGVEMLSGDVKILGAFLSHPYFWGSKPIGSESVEGHELSLPLQVWNFVYPSAPGGVDNPMINPLVHGGTSLTGLGCSKMLVCVAGNDQLRERGVYYFEAVRKSGWQGELEIFEVVGEDHAFHIINYESENSKRMINRLALFLK